MKKLLFILSFLLFMNACFAQMPAANENQDVGKLYANPENPPSFPGGESTWQTFIDSTLDKNIPAENGAPEGIYTVTARFIVGMDSVVTDVACENDPGYGMCPQAILLIRKSGKWKPATQKGRIVNAYKRQPIVFTIVKR